MKILYKFPSRSRPEKFFAAINNIIDLSASKDFEIVATLDLDDHSMMDEEVQDRLLLYPQLSAIYDKSESKVHAINRDLVEIEKLKWDILCLHSDDMRFVRDGFDDDIREAFERYAPDLDALVHFPDQNAMDRLITYPIMGRAYYNRFRYVYNPIYKSVYCDNEQHEVANLLGKYKYVPKTILKHLHAAYGDVPMDDLYRRNEEPVMYAMDRETFRRRKEEGFGLMGIEGISIEPYHPPIISILICSIPSRRKTLERLVHHLSEQCQGKHDYKVENQDGLMLETHTFKNVEILVGTDNKAMTTGRKRNHLYRRSRGKYCISHDDDDNCPEYYVEELLKAAESDADCFGITGFMTTDGGQKVGFEIAMGNPYAPAFRGEEYIILRFPNHITAIKRDICTQVKFRDVSFGEDYAWASEINERGLIKSQHMITRGWMYHYDYVIKK
jgi:hypothetical protein